jgi:hypothetical protein
MACACISNEKKIFISIQTAIIAFVLFNPVVFNFVRSILGTWVSSVDGCPTVSGLVLHSVLFGLIVYLLMIKRPRQNARNLPLQ